MMISGMRLVDDPFGIFCVCFVLSALPTPFGVVRVSDTINIVTMMGESRNTVKQIEN